MAQVMISLAQMDVKLGNPKVNWMRMQQMTIQAKAQGGHIVIFPELWDAGFALEQAKELSSSLSTGLFAQVAALSKQENIFITGSMLEKRGLGVSNSAPLISPSKGVMGAYRKIHLFPLMQEDNYLTAGESTLNIGLPWGQTSIAICYDLRFPELFRRYAVEGTKVVLVPCQWPEARIEAFRTLIRARALENGIYIVAVNRVGVDVTDKGETRFGGHSAIIDPFGETILELGSALEGVYSAPIEIDLVDKAQKAIPTLQDRRPEIYGAF